MDRLTRRQIEQHCLVLRDALGEIFPSLDDPSREYYWELLDEVGKMALQSLSQEAVRDEALREALACPRPLVMGEHACKNRKQCWEPCGDLGHHEEYALKREPNAAAQVPLPARLGSDAEADSRQVESATDACAKPAPAAPEGFRAIDDVVSEIERDPARKDELDKARARLDQFLGLAPDVASMVEQLRQWGPALKIGAAVPRAQVGDLMVQAAALLARLGQGWIPVSEKFPEENTRVLVRRGEGTDLFNPCVARYHYQTGRGEWWQYEPDFVSATQPTHWMPLPPAPGASDD